MCQEDAMNIGSISGFSSLQQQQSIQKTSAKLATVITALVSGNAVGASGVDVASLSVASQLQSAGRAIKQASANLAQASSLAQVADGGLEQIQNVVEQLQNLAQQSSAPTISEDNRKALSDQFRQLTQGLDRIVASTSFGGKKLLNGDTSGTDSVSLDALLSASSSSEGGDSGTLDIKNLASSSLFGGKTIDIGTPSGASDAVAILAEALNKVSATRADVGSFLQSTDYAAATIDTIAANQEAARSTLQDSDFAQAATEKSQASLQNNVAISIAAQGNRLSPALLQLIG